MSPAPAALLWSPSLFGVVFFFALGATVGSFLNVVVYRVPKGLGIVLPASACPACGTTLTWRENLPIIGWLLLRGRCRFCRSRISPEYPLVETLVAVLFGGLYALWYLDAGLVRSMGIDPRAIRPEWASAGLARTWPMFVMTLFLIGSLVAVTLIDAKTFLIPLSIPWLAGGVGLAGHPLFAWWAQGHGGIRSHYEWTIWTFDGWGATGLAAGAAVGLAIAIVLLRAGVISRSFADYEAWERDAEERAQAAQASSAAQDAAAPGEKPNEGSLAVRLLLLTGPALALMALGFTIGVRAGWPMRGMLGGMGVGLMIGVILRARAPGGPSSADPVWVRYPHARREMLREIVFLAPSIALGALGFYLARDISGEPALWIKALSGSLIGMFVGGGIVWAVRILGSLAFGKEAMGLGDVHLMASVGAVLGWTDPAIAFFLAPFFGIAWTVGAALVRRSKDAGGTALPYGPHLAAATLLVIYARPMIERGLSILFAHPITLP